MTTLRQQVETELGCAPTVEEPWYSRLAPSSWRKTMKYWAALWLGVVLGAIGAGIIAVLVGVVR